MPHQIRRLIRKKHTRTQHHPIRRQLTIKHPHTQQPPNPLNHQPLKQTTTPIHLPKTRVNNPNRRPQTVKHIHAPTTFTHVIPPQTQQLLTPADPASVDPTPTPTPTPTPSATDLPVLSVVDANYVEGDLGGYSLFYVRLDKAPVGRVEVKYRVETTGKGTGHATAGTDFIAVTRTVSFRAGSTRNAGLVIVQDDRVKEPDETFRVVLFDPQGATITNNIATITIKDND